MPPTPQKLDSKFTHAGERFAFEFSELPDYSESYTRDGAEIHRKLQCNWKDAAEFCIPLLGDFDQNNPVAGNGIQRILPHQHPHKFKSLYAAEAHLVNGQGAWTKDDTTGLIRFSDRINNLEGLAVWDVIYRQFTYDVKSDAERPAAAAPELYRFVTRDFKVAQEGYQLPGDSFLWGTPSPNPFIGRGGLVGAAAGLAGNDIRIPIPEGLTKRRPLFELHYIWHWVPEPLPKVLFAFDGGPGEPVFGRMNNALFDNAGDQVIKEGERNLIAAAPNSGGLIPGGIAPGYGLADTYEVSDRKWTPSGWKCRDITYKILYRPDSRWDQMWRQSLGRFDRIDPYRQNGDPIYKPGNFDALFGF